MPNASKDEMVDFLETLATAIKIGNAEVTLFQVMEVEAGSSWKELTVEFRLKDDDADHKR